MTRTFIATFGAGLTGLGLAAPPPPGPSPEMLADWLGLTADQQHQVELLYAEERAKHDALRLETQRRLREALSEEQRARLESVRPRPPHPECPQARGPRHGASPGGGVGGVAPFEGQRASRRDPP